MISLHSCMQLWSASIYQVLITCGSAGPERRALRPAAAVLHGRAKLGAAAAAEVHQAGRERALRACVGGLRGAVRQGQAGLVRGGRLHAHGARAVQVAVGVRRRGLHPCMVWNVQHMPWHHNYMTGPAHAFGSPDTLIMPPMTRGQQQLRPLQLSHESLQTGPSERPKHECNKDHELSYSKGLKHGKIS